MPRYYFDLYDNDDVSEDSDGVDLPASRMREEAISVLPEIAREVLPDGDYHTISVTVRSDDGRHVFEAKLTLEAKWLDERERPK